MSGYEANRPIYLQIMERIKTYIVLGTLKPGEKLLSLRDMSLKMKVNPNTMTRVYSELEKKGIVETRRGLGTFVLDDDMLAEKLKNGFEVCKKLDRCGLFVGTNY